MEKTSKIEIDLKGGEVTVNISGPKPIIIKNIGEGLVIIQPGQPDKNLNQGENWTSERSGNMEAGRGMDALIAEKVMGFTVKDSAVDKIKGWIQGKVIVHEDTWDAIPYYSAQIRDAWPIALELHKRKLYLKLSVTRFKDDQRFCVTIEDQLGQTKECEYSDNPAHAICLAALKAIESAHPAPTIKT